MKFEAIEAGEITIVTLSGELDTTSADGVQKQLQAQIDAGRTRLLLDLADLDFITSAGLRVLLAITKRVRAQGGELRVCHLNAEVQEVFEIAGFDRLLSVFGSRAEALTGF